MIRDFDFSIYLYLAHFLPSTFIRMFVFTSSLAYYTTNLVDVMKGSGLGGVGDEGTAAARVAHVVISGKQIKLSVMSLCRYFLRNRRKVYLNAVVWLAARVSMASAFIVTAVCLTMLLLAAAASTDEARSDLDAADSISPLA